MNLSSPHRTPKTDPVDSTGIGHSGTKRARPPASSGSATTEETPSGSPTEDFARNQSSPSSQPLDGMPHFHASTSVTASDTKRAPRIRKSRRIESRRKKALIDARDRACADRE